MKITKNNFIEFIHQSYTLKKSISMGIINTANDRVITKNVLYKDLLDFKETFDVMYGDDLKNKAFPEWIVVSIKELDGVDYKLEDFKMPKNKKEKDKEV